MPRRVPVINPFGYYHVSSRGNFGHALFQGPHEYELYLRLYARAAAKYRWETLTWVLLQNHYHFLIKLTNGGLTEGMREANQSFSRRMNALAGLTGTGHLVKHGFYAGELESESHLLSTCQYIDLNAFTAGRETVLGEWPWSGYRAAVGLEHPRPFHQVSRLLGLFGPTPKSAKKAYRRFLEDGHGPSGLVPSPGEGYGTVTK